MKSNFAFYLTAAVAVLALAQPAAAASKKSVKRPETLVAALQAVSPDALGGRLGLNIATTSAPKSPAATPAPRLAKSTGRSPDQLDYLSWKIAKKS